MQEASPDWMTEDVRSRFVRLYELQAQSGLSLIELSVRFLLAEPGFATMLIGAATPAQLQQSIAAARNGCLSDDLHTEIEALGLYT